MQKKLLTVAVASALALPAVAFAQVTVYGTMDGAIRNQSKILTATGTGSKLEIPADLRTTNRWGLRGSEDLGGGLMANFNLEGQYATDTGALGSGATVVGSSSNASTTSLNMNQGLFQRKAIVGLSKGGNSVDIGRDYTVNFKAQGIYDPMSYTYTGLTPSAGTNVAGTRSNNLVTAGFRFGTGGVRVDYALGEVVDEGSWGTRTGFMGDFAFGPVTIAGAFSTQKDAATGLVSTDTTNIGGVYRMGAFTFRAGWSTTEVENAGESPMWMLGVQYAISPTLSGRVGYYNLTAEDAAGNEVGKDKRAIVALDYILSKRTTAYVEFDRRNLSGTAQGTTVGSSLQDGATGLGVGIAHSF